MQVFAGAVSTPIWGNEGRRGSELIPQGSGRATLFASSDSFWYDAVYPQYTRQTTDGQTTHRTISATDNTVGQKLILLLNL